MNYEQRTRMLKLGSRKDIEGDAPFGRDFMSRLNLIGQTEALSDAYPGADISGSDRFNADHPYLTSAYRVMLPTLLAEVAGGAAGAAAGPVGLPLGIGIGALTGGLGGTLWDTIQKRELKRKLLAAGSKVDKGSLSRVWTRSATGRP